MIGRLLWSEIRNARKFSLFFILNLSIGLCGFLSLEFFKDSIAETLSQRSRATLGADFGMSARRPITPEEKQLVMNTAGPKTPASDVIEIFSMAADRSGRSTLVQIKAIERNFPFYGEIELSEKYSEAYGLHQERQAWVYPEVLAYFGIKVGDMLRLGEKEFFISGVVKNDSASTLSTNMAPRVYIGLNHLADTQLLKPGSIAWYTTVFHMPNTPSTELNYLRDLIFKKIPDEDLQVFTHENSSEQTARLLNYVNDFLGLTSLVALFLAAVGVAFLCHSYLRSKMKSMAILRTLGFSTTETLGLYFLHILVLGLVSALIALTASLLLLPVLKTLTRELVAFEIHFRLNPIALIFTLSAGLCGSFLIALPLILQLRRIKPALLLHEQQTSPPWDRLSLAAFVPSLAIFYGLSIFQANSWRNGSIFFFAFLLAVLLFFAVSFCLLYILDRLPRPRFLALAWSLRDLARQKATTAACFLTLALGSLLLNLIPQVEYSLQAEIKSPEQSKVPSLFLFDIQEDQVNQFKYLLNHQQVELKDLSPMVRGRLIEVNGQKFNKGSGQARANIRVEDQEMRFRNRGVNLSFRGELNSSESLVEGQPFSGTYVESSTVAQISLEHKFAERLNLKLGDQLTFDVQSVPITGRVVNLRKVEWTSFQPNFFILFQPGVLEEAPKTFLATLPKMTVKEKIQLQDLIVKQFPNISMVDVSRIVEKLREIINQISWALQSMSLLTLLAGFAVLYSIVNHQASQRQWDVGILKALGAPHGVILRSFLFQYLWISLAAALLGFCFSLVISYLLSLLIFDRAWYFNAKAPLMIFTGTILLSLVVTFLALNKSLKTKAAQLLSH